MQLVQPDVDDVIRSWFSLETSLSNARSDLVHEAQFQLELQSPISKVITFVTVKSVSYVRVTYIVYSDPVSGDKTVHVVDVSSHGSTSSSSVLYVSREFVDDDQ